MIIHSGFYLSGFTRIDKGEAGAVFVRYDDGGKNARKAEITETPLRYGGEDTDNYTVSIPKRKPRTVIACAIVTRTSKNCYQATAFCGARIETFKSDSLDGLRCEVAAFFKEGAA